MPDSLPPEDEIARLRAENEELRAELERRGGRRCPFPALDIKPEEPCPVCGDLGTFTHESMDKPSNCVERPVPRPNAWFGGCHAR